MKKKTIEERIEAAGEAYKHSLREKAEAMMKIEGPDAITLDGIEALWGQANKETEKNTGDFFNEIMSDNLEEGLLEKKRVN
jgi:hypothetical protein